MRIVCPACSAAYDVADALLLPGRRVRCARCQQEWQPAAVSAPPPIVEAPEAHWPAFPATPEADESTVDYEPTPRFSAMDRLALSRSDRRGSQLALRLAWAASILLLLGLCGAGYVWRADLIQAWPPSARVYSALGLMHGR